ncbi:MAG: DUF3891 family protein [Pseudomonadota bacterium]
MFISTKRAVVVPQSEHLRMCGTLAYRWGNDAFALPDMDREAFVLAIATHDRAFAPFDTDEIGNIANDAREAQVRNWIESAYSDPHAELMVLSHLRRLMSYGDTPLLAERVAARFREVVQDNKIDLALIAQADSITAFCDVLSFDFCRETDRARSITVFAGANKKTKITYRIEGGSIAVSPWPFSTSRIEDYILGYAQEGYPSDLQPVLMEYTICQG